MNRVDWFRLKLRRNCSGYALKMNQAHRTGVAGIRHTIPASYWRRTGVAENDWVSPQKLSVVLMQMKTEDHSIWERK